MKNVPEHLVQEALHLIKKEISDPANCEGEKLAAQLRKDPDNPKLQRRMKEWAFSFVTAPLLPEPDAVIKLFDQYKFFNSKEDKKEYRKFLVTLRDLNELENIKQEKLNFPDN